MKLHSLLPHLIQYKAAFLGVTFTSLAGTLLFIVSPAGGEVARTIARQQPIATQEIALEYTEDQETVRVFETELSEILITTTVTGETEQTTRETEPLWQSQEDLLPSIPQSEASTTPVITETTLVTVVETTSEATLGTDPAPTPVIVAPSGAFDDTMALRVLDLVNAKRAENGLSALIWNDTLAESADIRAPEIVVRWDHTRPDGSPWYTAGAQRQMGENLAYGQTSPEQVVDEWMASPSHAENILYDGFSEMGVSCYLENGVYYWVQHFA